MAGNLTVAPTPSDPYTQEQHEQMKKADRIEKSMTVFTLVLLLFPVVAGLFFGASRGWVGSVRVLACFGIFILMLPFFLKHVRETPKQVGVRTWMGGRIPHLVQEGWQLYIPYIWDIVRKDVTDKNTDLSQDQVMTKDGVVDVSASMTWHPDYNNPFAMIRYLDVGCVDGVEDIIDDPAEEGIRIHAIEGTTDQAQQDKQGFRGKIIDSIGRTENEEMRIAFKNAERHLMLKNVGIEIIQLTVPDVILPEEVLKRKQEIVNEKYDRTKEVIERDHSIRSIKKIIDKTGLTPELATDFWQTERSKVPKRINEQKIVIRGSKGGFGDLLAMAQIIAQGLAGRGKDPKRQKKGKQKDEDEED